MSWFDFVRTAQSGALLLFGDLLLGLSNVVFKWTVPVVLVARGEASSVIGLLAIALLVSSLAGAFGGAALTSLVSLRMVIVAVSGGCIACFAVAAVLLNAMQNEGVTAALIVASGVQAFIYSSYVPLRRTLPFRMYSGEMQVAGLHALQLSYQMGILVGPALGAAVVAIVGWSGIGMAILLCSFAGAAGLFVAASRHSYARTWIGGVRKVPSLRDWSFTLRNPMTRASLSVDFLLSALVTAPTMLVWVASELGRVELSGILQSAVGLGGAIGLVLPIARRLTGGIRVGMVLAGVQCVLYVVLGLTPPLWICGLICVLSGVCVSWFVLWRTLFIQSKVDDAGRGAAASVEYLVTTSGPKLGDARLSALVSVFPREVALVGGPLLGAVLLGAGWAFGGRKVR